VKIRSVLLMLHQLVVYQSSIALSAAVQTTAQRAVQSSLLTAQSPDVFDRRVIDRCAAVGLGSW
jgi:hypothetical protein